MREGRTNVRHRFPHRVVEEHAAAGDAAVKLRARCGCLRRCRKNPHRHERDLRRPGGERQEPPLAQRYQRVVELTHRQTARDRIVAQRHPGASRPFHTPQRLRCFAVNVDLSIPLPRHLACAQNESRVLGREERRCLRAYTGSPPPVERNSDRRPCNGRGRSSRWRRRHRRVQANRDRRACHGAFFNPFVYGYVTTRNDKDWKSKATLWPVYAADWRG